MQTRSLDIGITQAATLQRAATQQRGAIQQRGTRAAGRLCTVLCAWLCLLLVACQSAPSLTNASRQVTLVVDGQTEHIETEATTVRELLAQQEITLGDLDRVTPAETHTLLPATTVTVVRVTQQTDVITQTVPFGRQTIRDAELREGASQLLQSGQVGIIERAYRITYEDGQEAERALIRERLVQAPRDEVRLIGTRSVYHNVPITGTLAFMRNQDAWLIRDSSFQTRRITSLGDLDGRVFTLSPDGRRLLFTRSTTDTTTLNNLWLIRTTEAAPNPVPLSVANVLWADWAPSGDLDSNATIAWTTAEVQEQAPGWRGHNDLWRATVTDRSTLVSRRQVLEPESGGGYGWWGTRYVWSPTGETLAYSRPESIGTVQFATGERAELARFPALRTFSSWSWNPDITWSPDGDLLATVIHVADPPMSAPGRNADVMSTPDSAPVGVDNPEESPIFNLVQIAPLEGYSATLASEVGMWTTPRYAPDGQSLLFGRAVVPYLSATSRYNLYLTDRDGSGQRQIFPPSDEGASHEGGLELPEWTWSPDGAGVAFITHGDIHWMLLSSGDIEILTDGGGVTQFDWR
jgi:resuscitation-promoting factor RpfB